MTAPLDTDWARAQFPALRDGWTFFDNAGGSQVLERVPQRIADYLLHSNVAHSAPNELARLARERLHDSAARLAVLMNAAEPAEIVMGPSSTQLLQNLGHSLGEELGPDDEIVVGNAEHYANVEPWERLARKTGVQLKLWPVDPATWRLELPDLDRLMTRRTRLVTFTQASNILGTLQDVPSAARWIHERGAQVFVDGVAAAPHRAIDVRGWDVDYYIFSIYKVFGPHHAALYGRKDRLLALKGINHGFLSEDEIPYKLQPGNANVELSWGSSAVVDYLEELGARHGAGDTAPARRKLETAFDVIAEHEAVLGARLLEFLTGEPRVRLFGPAAAGTADRVPIISFQVEGVPPPEFPKRLGDKKISIRNGHFYAPQLMPELGVETNAGVVRVSMAHYNTVDEVDRLIDALAEVIAG